MTEIQKLTLFNNITNNTDLITSEDYPDAVFINGNVKEEEHSHTIITDKYFATYVPDLVDTILTASGSYFCADWLEFRMNLFSLAHKDNIPTPIQDNMLLNMQAHEAIIKDENLLHTFILEQIQNIISTEASLNVVLNNEKLIILEKPLNYHSCTFEEIDNILSNDEVLTAKLMEIRTGSNVITYSKEEIHSLYFNEDTQEFFYLLEDLSFQNILNNLTYNETTVVNDNDIEKFVLRVTEDEYQDYLFLYKKFNKLSYTKTGPIDDDVLYKFIESV